MKESKVNYFLEFNVENDCDFLKLSHCAILNKRIEKPREKRSQFCSCTREVYTSPNIFLCVCLLSLLARQVYLISNNDLNARIIGMSSEVHPNQLLSCTWCAYLILPH